MNRRVNFQNQAQQVYLNLVRTTSRLAEEFRLLFQEHGLSEPQFNVLRILRGAGSDGLPSETIGTRMVSRAPDITQLIDRLSKKGLVRRQRSREDRRVVFVQITKPGLELLGVLDPKVDELHRKQLNHIGEGDLSTLNRLLAAARNRPEVNSL